MEIRVLQIYLLKILRQLLCFLVRISKRTKMFLFVMAPAMASHALQAQRQAEERV